jgi:HemY protein
MARLEEGEHPGSDMVRSWLDRAVSAPADPAYFCAACGTASETWQARCISCGGFDTLAWQPARAPIMTTPTPPSELLPPMAPTVITGQPALTEQAKG